MYQKYYASQSRVIVDTGAKIAICLQAKGQSMFYCIVCVRFFLYYLPHAWRPGNVEATMIQVPNSLNTRTF